MLNTHKSSLLFVLLLSCTFVLNACGGAEKTKEEPTQTESEPDIPGGTGNGDSEASEVSTIDLGFATLTAQPVTLVQGKQNAKEVYQLAHYIGRTEGEASEQDIDIPIRSYQAACQTQMGTPKMFVSVSLDNADANNTTLGSVYELQYNTQTQSFDKTGNETLLPMCYESHGIAVSENCERIAVLCNTEYQASKDDNIEKDLIEEFGTTSMKLEDNHGIIDGIINGNGTQSLAFLMTHNYRKYGGFFNDNLDIADYLSGLQAAFPDNSFDENTQFSDLFGRHREAEMNYLVGQLNTDERNALHQYVRNAAYKQNREIWLLEWNNQTLTDTPKAYVVNKLHGGSHTGTQELIYTETDSQNRSSYGFTVTSRIFDQFGDTHYSAGLHVINRNNWSLNMSGIGNRGWWWACGDGHVINIRAFYNADIEEYGALCTSDGNRYIGDSHGALGSISVKMEGRSTSVNGYANYYVPSTNAWVSNGGGHTVVPVGNNTQLLLAVAPKMISDDNMRRFLDMVGAESGKAAGTHTCEDWTFWEYKTCFLAYMAFNKEDGSERFPTIPRQHLFNGDQLDNSSLTRVGIAKIDADGYIYSEGFKWLVEDDDCQISDPQLIDLKNGRYLLGYAKFQCISDGLAYHRFATNAGSHRMLKAKAYYVMEIDAEGNALTEPMQLQSQGWGGVDEPVYLGNGKVGWTFISNPRIDNYVSGQQDTWEVMVYHSKSVN